MGVWRFVIAAHVFVALLFVIMLSGPDKEPSVLLQDIVPPDNTAVVPTPKIEEDFYDWHGRHEAALDYVEDNPIDLVFIGDSITHMFGGHPEAEIVNGGEVWDLYYGERNAVNLGFGWDRTQNVLWRIADGELDGISPKAAVILIGTNNLTGTENAEANTPREIAAGIRAVCASAHQELPGCHIFLISLLPRAPEEHVAPIQEVNALIGTVDEPYITYVDLYSQFAQEDGLPKPELMKDTVHPNAAGYQVWADQLEPLLEPLFAPEEEDGENTEAEVN